MDLLEQDLSDNLPLPNSLVYIIDYNPENVEQVINYVALNNPTIIIINKITSDGTTTQLRDIKYIYKELYNNYMSDNCTAQIFLFVMKSYYNDQGYCFCFGKYSINFRFYSIDRKLMKAYLDKYIDSNSIEFYEYSDNTCCYIMNHYNDKDIFLMNKMLQEPTLFIHSPCDDKAINEILNTPVFQENKCTKLYQDKDIYIYCLEKKQLTKGAKGPKGSKRPKAIIDNIILIKNESQT